MHTRQIRLLALFVAAFFTINSQAQNYAVSLTGSNFVNCGSNSALAATNIHTMECWVKFNSLTGNQEVLSRSTSAVGIEILLYNNNLAFFCMYNGSNGSHIDYPTSNLSTGVWYHIAAVFNTTRESMVLYVNGKSVGTRIDNGNINSTGIGSPSGNFLIGQWSNANDRYLNATVDEVRVWSTVRTATELKQNMFADVDPTTTGLTAYYKMNAGTGTTVTNSTSTSGLNGTFTGTAGWIASPVQKGDNALAFDGSDDRVIVPANTIFNISTGTVECRVKPTGLTSGANSCIVGVRGANSGGGTRYSFHMSTGSIGLYNGSVYTSIPYTFVNGQTYHLAFVANGTNVAVYVDGSLAGTIAATFSSVTGQPLVIGCAITTSGTTMEPYPGSIDDVRIWSTQRTVTQINDNKSADLTGSETGLLALYTMNQGIANGTNTGLVTLIDQTSNNNHGTLTSFSLTGSTSNWSAAVVLPVRFSYFTGEREKNSVLLQWATAQEQNSQSFVVERSTDSRNFEEIGTVAAAGNSSLTQKYSFTDAAPKAGTNYYRLRQVDLDGQSTYTKTVSVQMPAAELMSIAPNPARQSLYYTISSLETAKAYVVITSAAGQKVWSNSVQLQAGLNKLQANVSGLPAGMYTLQVINATTGISSSQTFSVVK